MLGAATNDTSLMRERRTEAFHSLALCALYGLREKRLVFDRDPIRLVWMVKEVEQLETKASIKDPVQLAWMVN